MSSFADTSDNFALELSGEDYKVVLERLHQFLKPANYLEIGSRDGSSLALASCPTIAIDPVFQLQPTFLGEKSFCGLYRMGSDAFFKSFDPQDVLGGEVEFAFLDGLHLAEFLLRDFINTEGACLPNSVIAIHDCLPLDPPMARRHETGAGVVRSERYPDYWTGDVWKFFTVLEKYRPGLQVTIVDAQPTGLGFVTGLSPDSTVLSDHYNEILREFGAMTDGDLKTFVQSTRIHKTSEFGSYEDVAKFFWL